MGKGKGAPEVWVVVIKPGRMIFEMEGVTPEVARQALQLAGSKLSLSTQVRTRGVSRHAG
jgi:large subunit ribosomal protein L16